MKQFRVDGSNTFKRYAYVGKDEITGSYYVSLTDWPNRQGGSYSDLSLDAAIGIGREFVNGAEYRFDLERGIVLI
jgi:hypothetical protein